MPSSGVPRVVVNSVISIPSLEFNSVPFESSINKSKSFAASSMVSFASITWSAGTSKANTSLLSVCLSMHPVYDALTLLPMLVGESA